MSWWWIIKKHYANNIIRPVSSPFVINKIVTLNFRIFIYFLPPHTSQHIHKIIYCNVFINNLDSERIMECIHFGMMCYHFFFVNIYSYVIPLILFIVHYFFIIDFRVTLKTREKIWLNYYCLVRIAFFFFFLAMDWRLLSDIN